MTKSISKEGRQNEHTVSSILVQQPRETCKVTKENTSELHSKHLVHTQALAHAQVQHNLFTSTGNGVGANITVQPLDLTTLAATAVTETTEDLACLASTVLKGGGRLGLETGNGTTQLEHGLGVIHALALEDSVLQPVVACFDLACHVCQLQPNDGVVDEPLAKGLSLVGIFYGLFVADTSESNALDHDTDSLVVEVGHNH